MRKSRMLLDRSGSTRSILEDSNSQFTSLCWHRFQVIEPFIAAETMKLFVMDMAALLHGWHSCQVEAEVDEIKTETI